MTLEDFLTLAHARLLSKYRKSDPGVRTSLMEFGDHRASQGTVISHTLPTPSSSSHSIEEPLTLVELEDSSSEIIRNISSVTRDSISHPCAETSQSPTTTLTPGTSHKQRRSSTATSLGVAFQVLSGDLLSRELYSDDQEPSTTVVSDILPPSISIVHTQDEHLWLDTERTSSPDESFIKGYAHKHHKHLVPRTSGRHESMISSTDISTETSLFDSQDHPRLSIVEPHEGLQPRTTYRFENFKSSHQRRPTTSFQHHSLRPGPSLRETLRPGTALRDNYMSGRDTFSPGTAHMLDVQTAKLHVSKQ